MPVPNTFANATTSIPLSQLDANFATAITLGNTSIQLGNTVTTLNNMTFANVTVSSGSVTVANVTVTGVGTFAAGSNTAPSITTSGDTNTGFFFPAADTVATTTGGNERMRVDSAGQLGLGTTSPGNRLDVVGSGTSQIRVKDGVNATAYYDFGRDGTDGLFGFSGAQTTFSGYKWSVNAGSEVMRITNAGNVGIGTSSPAVKVHALTASATAVAFRAGNSVSFAEFQVDASGNSQLIAPGGVQIFNTNGAERMRIDSSGNVGIGTSSPGGTRLRVVSSDTSYADTILAINSATGTGAWGRIGFQAGSNYGFIGIDNAGFGYLYNNANNAFLFGTNNTERARIDASGNFFVGKTTAVSDVTTVGAFIQNNGKGVFTTTDVVQPLVVAKNANTAGAMIEFYYNGSVVGSITTNGTGVTYGTASDYRLKNSVAPLGSGLNLISALRPVTYKWNVDDSYGEGFIAHELQSVIPAAVSGEKDAINKDGSIKPQGVDYSKIVVHLVAAIQELKAEFDAYKAAHP